MNKMHSDNMQICHIYLIFHTHSETGGRLIQTTLGFIKYVPKNFCNKKISVSKKMTALRSVSNLPKIFYIQLQNLIQISFNCAMTFLTSQVITCLIQNIHLKEYIRQVTKY